MIRAATHQSEEIYMHRIQWLFYCKAFINYFWCIFIYFIPWTRYTRIADCVANKIVMIVDDVLDSNYIEVLNRFNFTMGQNFFYF